MNLLSVIHNDLCLVRRSNEDPGVYAASILASSPALLFGNETAMFDAYDFLSGRPVTVQYLGDVGVTLCSDSDSAYDTVLNAIQAVPARGFRVSPSAGQIGDIPTVICGQKDWSHQICRVRFATDLIQNADVKALVQHAASFELAMGSLPSGICVPRRNVVSVVDQYTEAAANIDLTSGCVIPFNNSRVVRGFLLLNEKHGDNVYTCVCFSRHGISEGAVLERKLKYRAHTTEEVCSYRSEVGEVVAVM